MLNRLRRNRASIAGVLLLVLNLLWLPANVHACGGAPGQAADAHPCQEQVPDCCEKSSCSEVPNTAVACPAMQAADTRERDGIPSLLLSFVGDGPTSEDRCWGEVRRNDPPAARRQPHACAPTTHPALRFRVLLI